MPWLRGQHQADAGDDGERRQDIGEAGSDFGQRHRTERGDDDRCREHQSTGSTVQHDTREPADQCKVKAMDCAEQHSPQGRADMMAQKICREIGERIQEALNAGRCNILVEPSMDQREGAVLMIISPIPIDVFAGKPSVDSARQERSQDHRPGLDCSARDHRCSDRQF